MDLISIKIQILGGNLFKNPGFKSPSGKVNFFVPFSFHFHINYKKLHTFLFNHFLISCFTNQISIKKEVFNMFYLISKSLKKIWKKWLKTKVCSFAWRILNKNKKDKKIFDRSGDLNPRFLSKTFPPKIWILWEIRSIELAVLRISLL